MLLQFKIDVAGSFAKCKSSVWSRGPPFHTRYLLVSMRSLLVIICWTCGQCPEHLRLTCYMSGSGLATNQVRQTPTDANRTSTRQETHEFRTKRMPAHGYRTFSGKPTAAVLCPWARHFTPRKYWLITQEAVAPSRHDWKIVDWDVKPQHKQTFSGCLFSRGVRSKFRTCTKLSAGLNGPRIIRTAFA